MEFKILRKDLMSLIESVSPALGSDKDLPALKSIQIEAFVNGITLSTFSHELSIKTFFSTEVFETAAFCVNGKLFTDIIKNLPDGELRLSVVDTATLKVHAGRKNVNINIMDNESFPISPKYEHFVFTSAGNLMQNVDKVLFAASKSDERANLMCVNINPSHIVAVDGHRMSLVGNTTPGVNSQFLLPSTSIGKIQKMFSGDDVEVCITDTSAHFKRGNTVATLRTLDTSYPDYNRVIPKDPYDIAMIRKEDLINALKLVSIITDDQKTVVLEFEEGILKVWAEHYSVGKIEDTFEVDFHKPMKLGLNALYLMDVVKRLKSEIISIELRDPLKPIVINEDGYLHVIMPKKI